jgi:hypothetical protein
MQKRIFLDGICVQKGLNRVRTGKGKDVKATNSHLRLVQEDCAFVLFSSGQYSPYDRVVSSDQAPFSKWIVNDILLSSKAATDAEISAELHNQSSIRTGLRGKAQSINPLLVGPVEATENDGMVYPAPPGGNGWYSPSSDGPKVKNVLLWWNALMGNDLNQCALNQAEPCPETCYWEQENSKYGDLLQLIGVQLVDAALQFVKVLTNADKMDVQKTDKAISDYLALISAQKAHPEAYIAVVPNSGADIMSQLHRLDPVYLSVDCKNFLNNARGPATLLPAPLVDPTGRAQKHAEVLTELLVNTLQVLEPTDDFKAGDLEQRLVDAKQDACELKALYAKHLNGIDHKVPQESPELQQCIRRAASRYVNWLQMLIDHRDEAWVPALDVDLMHQAHMMKAPEYYQFCQEVVGEPSDLRTAQPVGETVEVGIQRSAAMFASLVPGTAESYNSGPWGFFNQIITTDQQPLNVPPSRKDGDIYQLMPDQTTGLSAYQRRRRRQELQAVWNTMADGQNALPSDIVLQLGTKPHVNRHLWSAQSNRAVVVSCQQSCGACGEDAEDEPIVLVDQFVPGYEAGLPEEPEQFDAIVAMLMELGELMAAEARQRAETEAAQSRLRLEQVAKVWDNLTEEEQVAVDLVEALGVLPHTQREMWPAERNLAAVGHSTSVVEPTQVTKEKFVLAFEAEIYSEAGEDPTDFSHIVSVLE